MASVDIVKDILDQYGVKDVQASKKGNELGKDAFMNLLATQLQYQDPLEPTSDKEFLAQMAQFSALEQMQNLNGSMNMSQASGLIDKYVKGTMVNEDTGEAKQVVGIVDAVNLKEGVPYLLVNEQEIALSDIETVISDFGSETKALIKTMTENGEKIKAIEELIDKYLNGDDAGDDDDVGDDDAGDGDQ